MKLIDKINLIDNILKKLEKEVDDTYELEGMIYLTKNKKVVHKFTFA